MNKIFMLFGWKENRIKSLYLIPILAIFLVNCGQAPTPATVISQVTQLATVEVTRLATVEITQQVTVEVTRLIVITATYSSPTETPMPTATSAPTFTPGPTSDLTKTDKRDGSYMVGSEIAPGIWRSSGGSPKEECWLTIETFDKKTVAITGELAGGTIRIPEGEYIAYIGGGSGNQCTWSFLKP